jgi:lipoprotein-anchoring transpeptidase ErfK/SrfK
MLRGIVFVAAAVTVSAIASASAQDCAPWGCQGPWAYSYGWPQSQYPREYAPQPRPYWREQPARPALREPAERPRRPAARLDPALARQYAALYAPVDDEPFPVPAVRLADVEPEFLRKSVHYPTGEAPGTVVVDPQNHFLYLIEGEGRAIRYGVGVGRQGFGWSGTASVHDKQEWPDWYPPKEMLARQPELLRHMSDLQGGLGMPGGPRNPLGARALYLWQNDKDTLYRIHGTSEPWTIGHSVSSGCIRMLNQDVMDLYARTTVGAKVIVLPSRTS